MVVQVVADVFKFFFQQENKSTQYFTIVLVKGDVHASSMLENDAKRSKRSQKSRKAIQLLIRESLFGVQHFRHVW